MRCKCDYITFDQLEICPKCKKDISKISKALSGVTFRAQLPDFLQLETDESDSEEDFETEMDSYDEEAESVFDDDIDLEGGDEEIDFSSDDEEGDDDSEGGIEFELSADEDSDEAVDAGIELEMGDDDGDLDLSLDGDDDGLDLSLDGDDEDGDFDLSLDGDDADGGLDLSLDGDDEDGGLDLSLDGDDADGGLDLSLDGDDEDGGLDLSLGMESDSAKGAGDSLDLSGLDISDLSSSGEGLGDLALESGSGSASLDDALPDLEMDGLGTNASVPPPRAGTSKPPGPGAKTGTALDDFDIDLGDLG